MGHGHEQPCYYCGEPCDGFAANPSRWPLPLPHADEPGVDKWHHTGCVLERLHASNLRPGLERASEVGVPTRAMPSPSLGRDPPPREGLGFPQ